MSCSQWGVEIYEDMYTDDMGWIKNCHSFIIGKKVEEVIRIFGHWKWRLTRCDLRGYIYTDNFWVLSTKTGYITNRCGWSPKMTSRIHTPSHQKQMQNFYPFYECARNGQTHGPTDLPNTYGRILFFSKISRTYW